MSVDSWLAALICENSKDFRRYSFASTHNGDILNWVD